MARSRLSIRETHIFGVAIVICLRNRRRQQRHFKSPSSPERSVVERACPRRGVVSEGGEGDAWCSKSSDRSKGAELKNLLKQSNVYSSFQIECEERLWRCSLAQYFGIMGCSRLPTLRLATLSKRFELQRQGRKSRRKLLSRLS